MKKSAKTSRRKSTAKTELKANDPLHNGKTQVESKALAETVARFKAIVKAKGNYLFADYDFAQVVMVAAQVSRDGTKPEDAAKQALQILDACRDELIERKRKRKAMADAPVPLHVLHSDFRDGVKAITWQKRRDRAEEYFRNLLVFEIGSDAAAEQLKQLKRDGFTFDQLRDYQRRYRKFRPRRRKRP
jgi:hypothetical protein